MNKSMKKKALIASLLTLALCFGVLVGATFALLTSESKINIVNTAGDVDVFATIDGFATYSFGIEQEAGKFANRGTAVLNDQTGELTLKNITPGDKAVVDIGFTNLSDIAIKYRIEMQMTVPEGEDDLSLKDALRATATIGGVEYDMRSGKTEWLVAAPMETIGSISVAVEFPGVEDDITYGENNTDNDFSGKEANIQLVIYAVQGNAETDDEPVDAATDALAR